MKNPEDGQGRKWKCSACGAVYMDHQLDGVPYYHACGPVRRSTSETPDVVDRLATNLAEIDEAEKLGQMDKHVAGAAREAAADQAARAFTYVPIDGHRDENIVSDDGKGRIVIKSEGAGRIPV